MLSNFSSIILLTYFILFFLADILSLELIPYGFIWSLYPIYREAANYCICFFFHCEHNLNCKNYQNLTLIFNPLTTLTHTICHLIWLLAKFFTQLCIEIKAQHYAVGVYVSYLLVKTICDNDGHRSRFDPNQDTLGLCRLQCNINYSFHSYQVKCLYVITGK